MVGGYQPPLSRESIDLMLSPFGFSSIHPIIHTQSRLLAPQNPVGKASAHAPKDFMLSDLLVEMEQTAAATASAEQQQQQRQ